MPKQMLLQFLAFLEPNFTSRNFAGKGHFLRMHLHMPGQVILLPEALLTFSTLERPSIFMAQHVAIQTRFPVKDLVT